MKCVPPPSPSCNEAAAKTVSAAAKTGLAAAKTVLAATKTVLAAAKTVLAAAKTVWAAAKTVLPAVTPRPANFAIAWRVLFDAKSGFPESISLMVS